ncbi:oxygen-independent coproporphyrinogen III oxidase [Leptolyngbya sp. AN03gr2]|uniref:oxygen-independent coproporphyrinogen III oxidase n=1 Tax=unclassified Leptolyngbya TaxID=2650499 RepID=UPI003D312699
MKQLSQTVEFDATLLNQYNQPLPRYTSYPPATELSADFNIDDFRAAIELGNSQQTPLSLYCHIPFCETPCYFCGCNTIITQRKEVAEPYLGYLARQIRQTAQLINSDRKVHQLHWGGGTPNYLDQQQIEFLWNQLHRYFQIDDAAELSIEVNPRYLDRSTVHFLRQIGFNRISFGIQDFNPQVQAAVNRIQPEALLFEAMGWIREAGFESVNVDLIYGLPFQTAETFQQTVEKTIALDPDRIAVFNFAYVPWLKPIQKRISESTLPNSAEKLKILQETIAQLTQKGYVFIGMDHFAKPDDELAIAQRAGQLHRNFQGYTTKPETDLLGFGVTSISMLQNVYVQNHKRLNDYYSSIDAGNLPIEKGVLLSQDDLIRRKVIMELMCQFQLSNRDFSDYIDEALPRLETLEADGLIERSSDGIEVTSVGRLLIRNIAAVFDQYLGEQTTPTFSKAI